MTAPFPCNTPIQWKAWYSAGKDGFHNDIDAWSDPVTRNVISWTSKRILSRDGVHEVEDTDHLVLCVPPDFTWNAKDLAVIPGRGDYLVNGIVDVGEGFTGWKPGLTLDLLKGEG